MEVLDSLDPTSAEKLTTLPLPGAIARQIIDRIEAEDSVPNDILEFINDCIGGGSVQVTSVNGKEFSFVDRGDSRIRTVLYCPSTDQFLLGSIEELQGS